MDKALSGRLRGVPGRRRGHQLPICIAVSPIADNPMSPALAARITAPPVAAAWAPRSIGCAMAFGREEKMPDAGMGAPLADR